tara:strand:+ start:848 stop:1102 length:255 start_codon:yes stop_codon:yes gene_type:complete
MFTNALMLGGGKKIKSMVSSGGSMSLSVVVMLVFLFLLRALVVQWAYNKVAPKLISHWTSSPQEFRPLTFHEALLFTILVSFLV